MQTVWSCLGYQRCADIQSRARSRCVPHQCWEASTLWTRGSTPTLEGSTPKTRGLTPWLRGFASDPGGLASQDAGFDAGRGGLDSGLGGLDSLGVGLPRVQYHVERSFTPSLKTNDPLIVMLSEVSLPP